MDTRILLGLAGAVGAIIALGQISVDAVPDELKGDQAGSALVDTAPAGDCAVSTGPDVITGDMPSVRNWSSSGGEASYSFATTSCNIGDQNLDWDGQPSHQHPIISQNLFQIVNDRIEHIGMAWLKHGFCALQGEVCSSGCNGGGGCQDILHPCCSDPYSASRNGGQTGLGPKWQVNAHTGSFVLPWAQGEGTGGSFRRRLRAQHADLDRGGVFLIEGGYTAKDDALWGNDANNFSYRQVTIGSPPNYSMSITASTQREQNAVEAWQDFQPTVTIMLLQIDEDGEKEDLIYEDGLMIVGYDVIEIKGDGAPQWRYEYVIENLNAHRSGSAFSIEVSNGVNVTDIGFHDVDYHSGDGFNDTNYDGTDWVGTHDDVGVVTWTMVEADPVENSNALRWATLYNFYFTADAPPESTNAWLDLYRADPKNPDFNDVSFTLDGPENPCVADIDGSGSVDFGDILEILAAWGDAGGPADIDGSGTVDFGDILVVLADWGDC